MSRAYLGRQAVHSRNKRVGGTPTLERPREVYRKELRLVMTQGTRTMDAILRDDVG